MNPLEMLESTWNTVFKALRYIGILGIFLYYFMPSIFVLQNEQGGASLFALFTIIYVFLWVIIYLLYKFFHTKINGITEGLWSIVPERTGLGTVLLGDKSTSVGGKSDLLSEGDTMDFLSESFSFGFFLSVDNASIENIKGESLKIDNQVYQKLLVVPGAYSIEVDPLHETMRILFTTYKTQDYQVFIPTLKSRRWHQILITIEGRTADIYQNGILLKSVALPNVISARPGKPYIFMNSDMYARVAFVQSFNRRLLESDIIENYRLNTDQQGVPPFPKEEEMNIFGIPNFNFCMGVYCIGSQKPKADALKQVNYEYS